MQVAEAFAGFSPGRGGRAAPGDEPQALARAAAAPARALRRRARCGHVGADAQTRRAGVGDGRGLRRLRLPQVPQRRLRAARLPVDVAARPLRPGVPVRAAERAADGLLRPRQPRPRGPAAGASELRGRGRERLARCSARSQDGAVRLGLGYVKGRRPRPSCAGARAPSAGAAAPSRASAELAARAGARRATLEQLAWAGACDSLAEDGARRTALWQLGIAAPGAVAARRRRRRRGRGAPSTQLALPLELAAGARACARWGAGSG